MPPVVVAAGIGVAGAVAGGLISKSASDKQAEAAQSAAEAGAHSTTEEIVHHLPVESGAAVTAGYQMEAEFQKALQASLQAGNEQGFDWG